MRPFGIVVRALREPAAGFRSGFAARRRGEIDGFVAPARTFNFEDPVGQCAIGLRLPGGMDDATRQHAESRPLCLPRDARRDVAPVHYIPGKDEGAIRDSV